MWKVCEIFVEPWELMVALLCVSFKAKEELQRSLSIPTSCDRITEWIPPSLWTTDKKNINLDYKWLLKYRATYMMWLFSTMKKWLDYIFKNYLVVVKHTYILCWPFIVKWKCKPKAIDLNSYCYYEPTYLSI